MKVQENSITRSEEKLIHYKTLLNKHEYRTKEQEKAHLERMREHKRHARSVQMKREMVKSYKDKTLEEQQNTAFQDYMSDIERRRTQTPSDKEKRH